jgi:hypothetical protein
MVAAIVSPSSFESSGAHTLPSTLFNAIHNQAHVESDWTHFYESPTGEEEEFYQLMQEQASYVVHDGVYDYEHPQWTVNSSGRDVVISFDESRDEVWNVAKAEIEAYRTQKV